jgi:hypothetical protein
MLKKIIVVLFVFFVLSSCNNTAETDNSKGTNNTAKYDIEKYIKQNRLPVKVKDDGMEISDDFSIAKKVDFEIFLLEIWDYYLDRWCRSFGEYDLDNEEEFKNYSIVINSYSSYVNSLYRNNYYMPIIAKYGGYENLHYIINEFLEQNKFIFHYRNNILYIDENTDYEKLEMLNSFLLSQIDDCINKQIIFYSNAHHDDVISMYHMRQPDEHYAMQYYMELYYRIVYLNKLEKRISDEDFVRMYQDMIDKYENLQAVLRAYFQ